MTAHDHRVVCYGCERNGDRRIEHFVTVLFVSRFGRSRSCMRIITFVKSNDLYKIPCGKLPTIFMGIAKTQAKLENKCNAKAK